VSQGATRVASGAVLVLLAIAVVWLAPAPGFLLAAEALLLLAFREYVPLARASGLPVPAAASFAAAALTCAAFSRVAVPAPDVPLDLVLMSALVALAGITMTAWTGGRDALGSAAAAIFPSLYLGLPIGAMVAVREAHGREALFLLMVTVMVSDTAQFYSGRAFGRRLLAPSISPKKTIAGAVGGFVFGGVFLAIVGRWWLPDAPVLLRAGLGVTVVALGIVGDLFESMLKRSAGVKDSSTLIPGHGGILDRIDALLFAAPIYYCVLKYL
jgi:phosphatidate cytidylyltransferase